METIPRRIKSPTLPPEKRIEALLDAIANAKEQDGINLVNQLKSSTDRLITEGLDRAFLEAARVGMLSLVLALIGLCDVNTLTKARDNALHLAADEGHLDVVVELLKTDIRVDAKNVTNQTPFLKAATIGHVNILDVLSKHKNVDINAVDDDGRSALGVAAFQGNAEVAAFLLDLKNVEIDQQDRFGATPLMLAASEGNKDVVDLLIESGCNLNLLDKDHRSALICALDDEDEAQVAIAKILIDRGADVNETNMNGYTALHLAVQLGELDLIKCLLNAHANIEATTAPDYGRDTPLTLAVDSGRTDIALYLLEAGSLVIVSNSEAKTPLHLAVENKNKKLVQVLLSKGADLEAANMYGSTPLMVAAVEQMDLSMTKLLLDHNASLVTSNKNGDTLLSLAAMTQNKDIALLLYQKFYSTPSENTTLVSSNAPPSTVHVGDLIYFSLELDDDKHVLGTDGFLHPNLKPSPVKHWLDHLFVIHPQLSYDHVNSSAFSDKSSAITSMNKPDPYSEEEREKKRNNNLLQQIQNETIEVQYNTTYQLLHVKSQKYLRFNPLAAPGEPNVTLDAQGSCYSWFQFIQLTVPTTGKDFDEPVATSTPVSIVSACLGNLFAKSTQRAKSVVFVPPKPGHVSIGMYYHHERSSMSPKYLQRPCHLLHQDGAIACIGQRLIPLAESLETIVLPEKSMDSVFSIELLVANDDDWYQIRHIGTKYVLGMMCPCGTRDYNIPAVLLHENTTTMTMAAMKVDVDANLNASFQSNCVRCGHLWYLTSHKEKLYWSPDKPSSDFYLEEVPFEETQMLFEVYHWRESFLSLAHASLSQATPQRMSHVINHVVVTTQQICDLMDRQFEEDENNELLKAYKRVCIDMDILDTIFVAAACLDYVKPSESFTSMLAPFWKALRCLIIGNPTSERYLLMEFDASHGKIKIINALCCKSSIQNVDCTAIIATLIAKNPNSLELFLDQSNFMHDGGSNAPGFVSDFKTDPIRTMQLLIAMSSSDRSKLSFLTACKLEDHEVKVASLLLKEIWSTSLIETYIDPNTSDLAVSWPNKSNIDILLKGKELTLLPEATITETTISVPLQVIGRVIQPHLKPLWTEPFLNRAQKWCIFYLHQLQLSAILCSKNAACQRLFKKKYPLDVLMRTVESYAMKGLPYAMRSLFLQLLQYLYFPQLTTASQDIRLTTWYLNLDSRAALGVGVDEPDTSITSVAQESIKALISETLNHPKPPNNYFAFTYHILDVLERALDLGWYTSISSSVCNRILKTLFASGISWELITPVVYPDINTDMDPFDLLGASTLSSGVNKVVMCQRRLMRIISKVSQLYVLRSIEYTSDYMPMASNTMVQYLSNLACHSDAILAEAAMLNVAQILPQYNFPWMLVDLSICQKLKRVNADYSSIRNLFADANTVLDSKKHELRFTFLKENSKKSFHRTTVKRKDLSTSVVLQACRVSERWGKDPSLQELLILAHVPQRILSYLTESLQQQAFTVPAFETLNTEQGYFCPQQAFYPYRQFKEQCVSDRIKFAKSLLQVLKSMLGHPQAFLDDTKTALLNILGKMVVANPTFLESVGTILLEMLKGAKPFMPIDSRFTPLFKILVDNLQTSEMAGRCVLRLMNIAPRAEWKHDITLHLFHSDWDLKQVLQLVQSDDDANVASPSATTRASLSSTAAPVEINLSIYCNVLELLAMVADGKTQESMFGHLESKSIFSFSWLVDVFLQKWSTLQLKRVALILMNCLYFESTIGVVDGVQITPSSLPRLEMVFQSCYGLIRDLSTRNEQIVLDGILPWLRGWYTTIENAKARRQNELLTFHAEKVAPQLSSMVDLLDLFIHDHTRFTCVHTTLGLPDMMERLQRPDLCQHMAGMVWAYRRLSKEISKPGMEKSVMLCHSFFRDNVRKKVIESMGPILKEQQTLVDPAVQVAYDKIVDMGRERSIRSRDLVQQTPHLIVNDDEIAQVLLVARYILSFEPKAIQSAPHDLLAIVLSKQDSTVKPKVHKPFMSSLSLGIHGIPDPRKWLSSRSLQEEYTPMEEHKRIISIVSVDGMTPPSSPRKSTTSPSTAESFAIGSSETLDLNMIADHWKLTLATPVDATALLQALSKLVIEQTPSWDMAMGFLTYALRAKRLKAQSDAEEDEKVMLQSNTVWRKTLATAVKVNVAQVVLICVDRSMKDLTNPVLSTMTLQLISEFLADGYEDAQDALYVAFEASDPKLQSIFFEFLIEHIERQTHAVKSHTHHDVVLDGAISSLTILQLLCENHHHNWQSLMRSVELCPPQSCLDNAIELLSAICSRGPRFEPNDMKILSKVFSFLSEACQGPCLENQAMLTESVVPKWCAAIILDFQESHIVEMDRIAAAKLKKNASEVLLSMTECRNDVVVHIPLAHLLLPDDVAAVLSKNREQYNKCKNEALKHAIFEESIEILRVVNALLVNPTADPSLAGYSKSWKQLENPDVDYFQSQTISVQIVRGDATVVVYFPKPKEAKYLQRPEQKRLLDAMEIGTENALSVFTSQEARTIDEELKTRLALANDAVYGWMAEHNIALRRWMFTLCVFINLVLVLGMEMNEDTMVPVMKMDEKSTIPFVERQIMHVLFKLLTGLFAIICSSLWLFHITTSASFHYAKQRITPMKLYMLQQSDVRQRIMAAVFDFLFMLAVFVAIFVVIFFVYGTDDAVTQINGVLALLVIVHAFFKMLRSISGTLHFMYIAEHNVENRKASFSSLLFWYNVIFDTVVSDIVVVFTLYTLCAFTGLFQSVFTYGYLFYGIPLLDLLGTNARLANILKAVTLNLAPLGVTMAFGLVVIYVFSLFGFFFFQSEISTDDAAQCQTMMECFFVYVHYGLLSGGGIGDYTSNQLNHALDYSRSFNFYIRLVYNLLFYIIVLLFLINVIMGIIIDAFGALREAAEAKERTALNSCIVCNTSKDDIEYAGIRMGLRDNFTRHTQEEHNLWYYFFFIMYLNATPVTDMNGTESFVYQKIQAKEMSWIPKNRDTANDSDIEQLKDQVARLQELIETKLKSLE
ncbi:ankyrin-1-like [Thraustotheca clavata]|uniref:Ankyrin-1-like n=1 Tax=Thraustotheca clavata TaxID=74557 RepID=A0A1W0A661_9STRA|nr:ankyrin-1-like [Thraustotheca clavata]